MKVCPNCNNTVEDNAIFCDKCGTRFAAQNNAQNGYYQQPTNNVNYTQQPYNYGANQQPYQPAHQKQPKKKNTGLIIGIIAAVLIVLAIIGSVAEKAFQSQGYGSSGGNNNPSYNFGEIGNNSSTNNNEAENQNTSTEDNNVSDTVSYNKGTFADGVDVNDWANMQYDAGSIWTDGTADEYASYEGDPNTECGVILNDATNGKQLVICFEKLTGTNVLINEDTYLDAATSGLKDQYASMNLTCEMSDYYDTTIAGEKYRTVRMSFEGTTMVQDFHVRKLDNYIIFVAVTAQDNFDAAAAVNNIRTAE